jgi:hypothetical protein
MLAGCAGSPSSPPTTAEAKAPAPLSNLTQFSWTHPEPVGTGATQFHFMMADNSTCQVGAHVTTAEATRTLVILVAHDGQEWGWPFMVRPIVGAHAAGVNQTGSGLKGTGEDMNLAGERIDGPLNLTLIAAGTTDMEVNVDCDRPFAITGAREGHTAEAWLISEQQNDQEVFVGWEAGVFNNATWSFRSNATDTHLLVEYSGGTGDGTVSHVDVAYPGGAAALQSGDRRFFEAGPGEYRASVTGVGSMDVWGVIFSLETPLDPTMGLDK